MLFANRLEVWNPGRLPSSLTLAGLRKPHGSVPHNPLLAEPLYLTQYIERLGTGDMIRRCRDAGLKEPEFSISDGFALTIWRVPATKMSGEMSGKVAGKVAGESGGRSGGSNVGESGGESGRESGRENPRTHSRKSGHYHSRTRQGSEETGENDGTVTSKTKGRRNHRQNWSDQRRALGGVAMNGIGRSECATQLWQPRRPVSSRQDSKARCRLETIGSRLGYNLPPRCG